MGRDLKLLPLDRLDNSHGLEDGYSHVVLSVRRDSECFDAIDALDAVELAQDGNVSSYVSGESSDEQTCYGLLREDPLGNPVTHVAAGDLARVLTDHHPREPWTAYIRALPPAMRVALWWC